MKTFKKVLKRILIGLFILIALAFAAPYLFKGKIVAFAKKQINQNINAKVDFKDVDISFFRHFPRVAVGLDDINITGTGIFEGDTLLSADRIDAAVNLMSIVKGNDMTIYSVVADAPRIHAIVNKEGFANWDIMKPDTTAKAAGEPTPFKMALKSYEIKNAYINYKDEQAGMSSEIKGLNHKGSGDFTSDQFTLKTNTDAASVTFTSGGVPFLLNTKTDAALDLDVNTKTSTYTFNTENISLNDLKVSGKGFIKMLTDGSYDMDISFKAPSTDFKNILSLVPGIYQKEFSKVKATGSALFSGFVKGIYSDKQIPSYNVDLQVKDGTFQYSDLPKPVKDINVVANFRNPDGKPDNTVVDIKSAHLSMDNDPFDFRLLMKNPVTNMFVDAAAKGKLDLSKVAQFVKLDEGTKLSGLLNADVSVKGNVADIEAQRYQNFTAGGIVNLSNFLYVAKDYPTGVKINNLATDFTPSKINISALSGQYLSSNFTGSGYVNNLLSYMLANKPLDANLTVNADKINLNEWMGTTSADAPAEKGNATAAAPFVVPANLNVQLNTQVGSVHYDKLDITNLSGALKIKDEAVYIENVKGNALDGTVAMNGSYSTKASKTKPDISMQYDVTSVDVQKTFLAFNTVQKLMPIGKFIAGKLTSHMTLNGKLGENMMPDLATMSGNGNMLLLEGVLSKFAPLDKIASTLNVKSLEQMSLKDIKNSFEFSNGKVLVKPFNVNLVNNIAMEIGGTQSLDQTMDYAINMKLPKALMGSTGNQLISGLQSKISSVGIPVNTGDFVNLKLGLGGTMTAPSLKVNLKGAADNIADQMKSQVTDFAKSKIDSAKSAVRDTVASIKKQAIASAKDELLKKLGGNKSATDTAAAAPAAKPKPVEAAKGIIKGIFGKKH
jgi:hypothetical protein